MILESLVVLGWLVSGAAMARLSGLRGWVVGPMGFLLGVAAYIAVGLVLVVTPLPNHPLIALALSLAGATVWWVASAKDDTALRVHWRDVGLGAAAALSLVFVFVGQNLVKWHVDSFDYLNLGQLLAGGGYDEEVRLSLIETRLIGVPYLHAMSGIDGSYYMRSATPLIALASLATLVWLLLRGFDGRRDAITAGVFGGLGAAALATVNRFDFHALYINGHLLVGAVVMAVAGCAWLAISKAPVPHITLALVMAVLIPAAVVTRAEGAPLIALALFPYVARAEAKGRPMAAVLFSFGGSVLVWNTFVVARALSRDETAPLSSLVLGAVAVVALGAGLAALKASLGELRRWLPAAGELGLWALLGALALRDSAILEDSLAAASTLFSPFDGVWGWTVWVYFAVGLGLLAAGRFAGSEALRYPWTTFIPLVFVLAYARDGAYHVFLYDSLNRMLIEVLPVLVLFIAASVGLMRVRWTAAPSTVSASAAKKTKASPKAKPASTGKVS